MARLGRKEQEGGDGGRSQPFHRYSSISTVCLRQGPPALSARNFHPALLILSARWPISPFPVHFGPITFLQITAKNPHRKSQSIENLIVDLIQWEMKRNWIEMNCSLPWRWTTVAVNETGPWTVNSGASSTQKSLLCWAGRNRWNNMITLYLLIKVRFLMYQKCPWSSNKGLLLSFHDYLTIKLIWLLTLLSWKESIKQFGNAVFAQQSKLFCVLDVFPDQRHVDGTTLITISTTRWPPARYYAAALLLINPS